MVRLGNVLVLKTHYKRVQIVLTLRRHGCQDNISSTSNPKTNALLSNTKNQLSDYLEPLHGSRNKGKKQELDKGFSQCFTATWRTHTPYTNTSSSEGAKDRSQHCFVTMTTAVKMMTHGGLCLSKKWAKMNYGKL